MVSRGGGFCFQGPLSSSRKELPCCQVPACFRSAEDMCVWVKGGRGVGALHWTRQCGYNVVCQEVWVWTDGCEKCVAWKRKSRWRVVEVKEMRNEWLWDGNICIQTTTHGWQLHLNKSRNHLWMGQKLCLQPACVCGVLVGKTGHEEYVVFFFCCSSLYHFYSNVLLLCLLGAKPATKSHFYSLPFSTLVKKIFNNSFSHQETTQIQTAPHVEMKTTGWDTIKFWRNGGNETEIMMWQMNSVVKVQLVCTASGGGFKDWS